MGKQEYVLLAAGRQSKAARALHLGGRHNRAAVVLKDKKGKNVKIHVSNGYLCVHATSQIKKTQRERQLKLMSEDAEALGSQPVFICVDNASDASPLLAAVLATGEWFDLGAVHAGTEGPAPTFSTQKGWDGKTPGKGITKPDRIYANVTGNSMGKKVELVRDLGIKSHLGLRVHLDVEKASETTNQMEHMGRLPIEKAPKLTDVEKAEMAKVVMRKHCGDYQRHARARDAQKA